MLTVYLESNPRFELLTCRKQDSGACSNTSESSVTFHAILKNYSVVGLVCPRGEEQMSGPSAVSKLLVIQ